VLHEVAPHARREVRAIDERTADGGLGQAERAAHLADEAARVLLVRRREERPERVDAVDGGQHVARLRRQDRREARGRQQLQQRLARRDHVLVRRALRGRHPLGAELRPRGEPERPERVRGRYEDGVAAAATVVDDGEQHGVEREDLAQVGESPLRVALRRRFRARGLGRPAARDKHPRNRSRDRRALQRRCPA
jgi:hypothetical protein